MSYWSHKSKQAVLSTSSMVKESMQIIAKTKMIEGSHELCNKIAKSKTFYQHLCLIFYTHNSIKKKTVYILKPLSTSHIMHTFKNTQFYTTLAMCEQNVHNSSCPQKLSTKSYYHNQMYREKFKTISAIICSFLIF